ncbi:MAG: sulfite exporter TauE/SafE family protein [Sphingobacteriaceae bacterium]|nr:sulfite exporter TauE/SafE family protein [Sphingobacteriaceae bacterium]
MGLIGGGGSILGVPILVYLEGLDSTSATSYSLFIVGITSLIGSFTYLKNGNISVEAIVQFAIASVVGVFCTRKYILPAVPEEINFLGLVLSKNSIILVVFAVLMLGSSYSMIKKRKPNLQSDANWREFFKSPFGIPFIVFLGLMVGLLTGFVGAGGGFIIVPVLMTFLKLNFKKAIGTSLTIIALNSLIGFTGNLGNQEIDWKTLLVLSAISISGIIIGSLLAGYISAKKLKPAFGWFTLIIGIFVLGKEIFFK